MVIDVRNVMIGIRNILPSNTILARDVEIEKLIFHGQNTVREFCAWLFSKQHANVTVIAHNARAYDAYFIYNYLLEQIITPEIILKVLKLCTVKLVEV